MMSSKYLFQQQKKKAYTSFEFIELCKKKFEVRIIKIKDFF
jgi:hypothetical protein